MNEENKRVLIFVSAILGAFIVVLVTLRDRSETAARINAEVVKVAITNNYSIVPHVDPYSKQS